MAELLLYLANFVIQRDFIFSPAELPEPPAPTDWDRYYASPYKTAGYARRIVGRKLLNLLRRFQPLPHPEIAELGGGNSCFFERIETTVHPARYVIYDNNGARRAEIRGAHRRDVPESPPEPAILLHLNPEQQPEFDVVVQRRTHRTFSAGTHAGKWWKRTFSSSGRAEW